MKLILLTLCVLAVTHADVRWDPSGQYRILVTEPVEQEPIKDFKIETKPLKKIIETPSIVKKYKVVDLDDYKIGSYPYPGYPNPGYPYPGYPYPGYPYPGYPYPAVDPGFSVPYVVRSYVPFHYDYQVKQ